MDQLATGDLLRARKVLERMQANQTRLAAELDSTGLISFVARSEWLIAHRNVDVTPRRKPGRPAIPFTDTQLAIAMSVAEKHDRARHLDAA